MCPQTTDQTRSSVEKTRVTKKQAKAPFRFEIQT